jgi:FkbM family methyltransferase
VQLFNGITRLRRLQRFFSEHPLTSDALLGAWLRFLSWQMRSRIQPEIMIKWVGGQRLLVRHGMTGATGNIYVGLHEFFDMMVPIHFLRPGDLFLDIGANVGTYTVLASGVCRANTFAFEPDPDTVCHLKKNIDVNRLSELVRVYECALGATRGDIAFTVGNDTVNRIATKSDTHIRMVRMERLDAIIVDSPPIMMKADVEGAELDVLLGAEKLLASPCLKVIELETVNIEISSVLARNGFERAFYEPFSRSLSRTASSRKTSNSLFVRDWSFVETRLKSAQEITILGRRI